MINTVLSLHRNSTTQPRSNFNDRKFHPLKFQQQRLGLASYQVLARRPRSLFAAAVLALAMCTALLAGGPLAFAEGAKATAEVATVNINTADAPTLAAALKGVGESRAVEIVRYREAYGPFGSADELTEVKGIGQSTLDMNRQRITLE